MRQAREHEIQAAIVDALRLCGVTVYETTAYRQKGASGVDRGIPDLLVSVDFIPFTYLGLEVKTNAEKPKWSSKDQQLAGEMSRFGVVDDPLQAVKLARRWLYDHGGGDHMSLPILAVLHRMNAVIQSLGGAE